MKKQTLAQNGQVSRIAKPSKSIINISGDGARKVVQIGCDNIQNFNMLLIAKMLNKLVNFKKNIAFK